MGNWGTRAEFPFRFFVYPNRHAQKMIQRGDSKKRTEQMFGRPSFFYICFKKLPDGLDRAAEMGQTQQNMETENKDKGMENKKPPNTRKQKNIYRNLDPRAQILYFVWFPSVVFISPEEEFRI